MVAIDWNDLPVGREFDGKFLKNVKSPPHALLPPSRLCIKVGRGQGDGDIGTRVLGLGTWGSETKDLRTSSMGRGDVWDRDAGTSNTETQGTRDVTNYSKVGGKCDISFFVKICYLWSTLDSIFQNHIRHLMMFTQNISL